MIRFIITTLVLAALLFPLTAAAEGNVPTAAASIAKQLDEQLMMRFSGNDSGTSRKDRETMARAHIMIMGTTPSNINDLEQSSALSRQMTEEISRWLINAGYRFQELRKGRDIRFDKYKGEFILTRDVRQLSSTNGSSQAIMAGTYVTTSDQVRFSIKLIHTSSNEVLAMGTATVPITDDLRPLVRDRNAGEGLAPTVSTRLQ
jgi:hypothetical protein